MIEGGLPGDLAVVVTRPGPKNQMGDPTGPPAVHTVSGCLLAPGGTSEDHDRAQRVVSDWDLYAPEDADIAAPDRISVPHLGVTAEVAGDPRRWPGAGVVVPLRRVTG